MYSEATWFCVAFILFHLILRQPYQLHTDIVPIFQTKKLKLRQEGDLSKTTWIFSGIDRIHTYIVNHCPAPVLFSLCTSLHHPHLSTSTLSSKALLHTALLDSTRLSQAHPSLSGHTTSISACMPASIALFSRYFIFLTRL